MFRVLLGSTAISIAASLFTFPAQAVEVYMFRGAGDLSFVAKNLHFSRGLDKMVDQLNAEGIHAEVRMFQQVDSALATIRQRRPESVAFVGHSMGALASMAIAKSLKKDGINIVYMGLIDIPGPVGVAGDNVARVDNFYSINPVYGKLTNTGSHPNARNIHVGGYMHNRMDDAPEIQNGILSAIREIHALEQLQYQQLENPQYVEVPATVDPLTTASVPQQLPQVQPLQPLQPVQPVQPIGSEFGAPVPQVDVPNTLVNVPQSHSVQPVQTRHSSVLGRVERLLGGLRSNGTSKKRLPQPDNSR
ncbi:MAG: thioesterase domain-containing protein [Pseudomonadota bacterium]